MADTVSERCYCTPGAIPPTLVRRANCPTHGDGTPWWESAVTAEDDEWECDVTTIDNTGCSCTLESGDGAPNVGGMVLVWRDPACVRHGDDSAWWAQQQSETS